jgi:hypothetical protein
MDSTFTLEGYSSGNCTKRVGIIISAVEKEIMFLQIFLLLPMLKCQCLTLINMGGRFCLFPGGFHNSADALLASLIFPKACFHAADAKVGE